MNCKLKMVDRTTEGNNIEMITLCFCDPLSITHKMQEAGPIVWFWLDAYVQTNNAAILHGCFIIFTSICTFT